MAHWNECDIASPAHRRAAKAATTDDTGGPIPEEGDAGSSEVRWAQRLHHPFIKEYALNHIGDPTIT